MTAFSVVVNTCNRAPSLRTLLYSLNHQTFSDFEVVVVLGPSSDASEQVVGEFAGRLTLVRCPEFNLSMSRNMGISAASGEIIAFIDDDAVPSPTWLEQLEAIFRDPEVAGAGGQVRLVTPGHSQVQFRYGQFSLLGEDRDVRATADEEICSETPSAWWYSRLMGTNMAYRRQALLDVGGFDERFAYLFEEPDLAVRLAGRGYRIRQTDLAMVYHAPVSSPNRVAFTPIINWYASMRGILYFSLKNAAPRIGVAPTLVRCVRHVVFYFESLYHQYRDGAIPPQVFRQALSQVVRGVVWGFAVGLFGRRRTRNPGYFRAGEINRRPVPFLCAASARHPAIPAHPPLGQGNVRLMRKPPRHICLLSHSYPPVGTEGVARLTHTLALGMTTLGHDTHVITAGKTDRTTVRDGAYIHEVTPTVDRYAVIQRSGYPRAAACLQYGHAVHDCVAALKVDHRAEIVDSPLWTFEGLVTARSQILPVVTRQMTSMSQLARMEGYRMPETELFADLEGELLRSSAGLIPLSRSVQRVHLELYGPDVVNRPQQVIQAGIIPLADERVAPLSGRAKPDPVVLFVGRLEKRKGMLRLFEAMASVLESFPRAQLWLAGRDNSQHDGFANREHPTYAHFFRNKYGATVDNVRFLGYVPDDRLGDLYDACDMFVAPSLYESFGLVFLEAMNRARPVIGCAVGGPTEVVVHEKTGLLVEPEDAASLAQAITTLIRDAGLRREMGLAGRQRLLDEFHYLDAARRFVAFYEEFLN